MASYVQNLLNNTIGDGARSTKFECMIVFNLPNIYDKDDEIYTLIKTSNYPGKSHDIIDLKYKGRSIPIKGQTKYDNTWECTFYLTQDHKLKKAFEDWMESLDQKHNIKEVSAAVKSGQINNNTNIGIGYGSTMQMIQMDFDGTQQTAIYELYNVFPKSVSAVSTDYSALGEVLEFTVEFSYSHFNTKNIKTADGNFVDELKSKVLSVVGDINGLIKSEIKNTVTGVFENIKDVFENKVFPDNTDSITIKPSEMATQKDWSS